MPLFLAGVFDFEELHMPNRGRQRLPVPKKILWLNKTLLMCDPHENSSPRVGT